MVKRPKAIQAAISGARASKLGGGAGPLGLGQHVDDAAKQHRFGKLRHRQGQIGNDKQADQAALVAQLGQDAGVKAQQRHRSKSGAQKAYAWRNGLPTLPVPKSFPPRPLRLASPAFRQGSLNPSFSPLP